MKNQVNLLITLDVSKEERARLQAVSERLKLTVLPASNLDEISKEHLAKAEVLFTQGFIPDPQDAPNLKWVQINSAGVDDYLDKPLIHSEAVHFTTMSGVITRQIGEYVLMALLALGQKLPELVRLQIAKQWPDETEIWHRLLPVELRHSTVGILGYGSIGRQVARLLQPFGATILAAKKDVMHPEDTGYIIEGMGDPHGEFFDRLYPIEALNSLLKDCDFVVLTLPLTENTRKMINADTFEVMKPTAYLINVGRGGLIDEQALINALKAKQIAGAVLDVFETEPLPAESPLWAMENVIITPHLSGISQALKEDTLAFFIENLNRYLAELPLYNQVDLEKGY